MRQRACGVPVPSLQEGVPRKGDVVRLHPSPREPHSPMAEPDRPYQLEALRWLELRVEKMRALGVTEFDGIKLGPDPSVKSETPEQLRERREELMHEHHIRSLRIREGSSGGPKRRVPT